MKVFRHIPALLVAASVLLPASCRYLGGRGDEHGAEPSDHLTMMCLRFI